MLRERCQLYAPDPSLLRQYAQDDDNKRFEYSLSQELPPEVLTKRKLSTSQAESGPFQIPALTAVVNTLCPQLSPAETFCIVSEPGSLDQVQHTDSIPMEGQSDESWQSSLHYIGALIPLQATDAVCGQTAVIPTSHLNPCAVEEINLSMNLGDVLVMDGRTTHRGLANVTSTASSTKNTLNNRPLIEDKDSSTTTTAADDDDIDEVSDIVVIDNQDKCDVTALPPSPRKICFFTYTLPHITDGNALAYSEHNRADRSEEDTEGGGQEQQEVARLASKKVKILL